MDSRRDLHVLMLTTLVVAVSGATFYLGVGLAPHWWAMWIASLPMLWLSARISWFVTAAAALAARAIGGLSMWGYHARLQFPLWLKIEDLLAPALAFGVAVLMFRGFVRRGKYWLGVLAFPCVIVGYEYLYSLRYGTFGNTAYTQLNVVPILQLAALTGLWGTSFAVMLFSPLIASILLARTPVRHRLAVALIIIFACIFSYGAWRIRHVTEQEARTLEVGLVVSDLPRNTLPETAPEVMRLMHDYTEQVSMVSRRGAKIVVLPEMTALVTDSTSPEVDNLFEQTARAANVQIVLGVLHVTSNRTYNEARFYSESGTLQAVYRKHHLVPVAEGRSSPGNDINVLREQYGTVGLEVCRDMDYPNPARQYGLANVGLLVVPAWDFDIDRYWHGHMAVLRGVEDGFTVVRSAKSSLLTVSDDRGRILAETRTIPTQPFTTMLTSVPIRHDGTLYQHWGDWFAWLNLGLLVAYSAFFMCASNQAANPSGASERTDKVA